MNSNINWIYLWRLPIQNHSKPSFTEKGQNKAKYVTWNSRRLKLRRKTKALNISNTLTRVVPDLFHALAILSEKTVIRSTIDREDLKSYWKSEKRLYFSRWWTSPLSTSFSKTLLTTEIGPKGQQFLVVDFSPTFLNTGTTDETFHH